MNNENQRVSYDDIAGVGIQDSSGKVTRVPYSQAKDMGLVSSGQDLASSGPRTAYKTAEGTYTTDIVKADFKPSITLDENTGKITVSAPQMVLDDASFKSVINPDILKQFSSAYQRNKDYKVPDPFDESDESKDITIPELVSKYDDEIKKLTYAMQEELQSRKDIASGERGFSNRNDIANRLTREDMIVMGTNALEEGANDDSLIAIPKSMFADVNFLESFDANAGTVKKGEFRDKVFSLKKHDENYIDSLYNRLDQYFEEDNFDDTDEYARATALYGFLLNNDPDADPGQTSNYVTSSLFRGLGHGLGEVGSNIGKVTEFILGASPEYIEAEYKDENKEYEEAAKFLSRMSSAGATALAVGDMTGKLGGEIAAAIATGNLVGGFAEAATFLRGGSALIDAAKTGQIAQKAGEAAKAASSIAKDAESLATGADVLIAANSTKRAAEIGAEAAKLATTASRVGTVTDLAAQTISEAVISDPVVFAKILQNQEQAGEQAATAEDAYGDLLEIAAWNIGGWGAFNVGAKAIKSFGATKAGRYTNAVAQKYLNKVPAATGSLGEKILRVRYGDEWLSGSRSPRVNQARKYNYELRQAQEAVSKQKIGSVFNKDVGKNVREQEENIVKLMNLHNATDAVQRGSRAYIQRMINGRVNPTLSGYEQKLRKLGSEITKLERRAGLSTRRKKIRLSDKDVSRVFSKQSANYLGSKTELDVLRNVERVKGSLSDAQKKGKALLEAKLAAAQKALPKEIQENLDAYLAWDRKFYAEYNNIRMREGSLNSKQIEELRAEGYWGKNGELYRPAYRVDPDKETKLIRNDDRVARDNDTSTEQYVWGSDKDFMDPEIARYMYMGDAGSTLNATRYIEAINAIPSSKAHVVYDADEVARAQRMKDVRKPLNARIKSVTKGLFKSGAVSSGESAERAVRLRKMREAYVKQRGKTIDSALNLSRMSRNKVRITVSDKRTAIDAMTQAQLDDIFSEAGITFDFNRMTSREEFAEFYNSLDKTTQKYLQQRMGNVAGILYPAEIEQPLERAIERFLSKTGTEEKIAPTRKKTKKEWKANPVYDEEYADRRGMDLLEGRISKEDYLEEQKERMWESFKNSNQGVDSWLIEAGEGEGTDFVERRTMSNNGTLYRELYSEYGGKPPKDGFYEAFDDVIKNGENSKYYYGFREFDRSGRYDLGYNAGNEDIETIIGILEVADEKAMSGTTSKKVAKSDTSNRIEQNEPDIVVKNAPYITAENYNKLAQMDPSFVPGLKKSLAQNRKDLRDSNIVTKTVEDGKRAQLIAEREGLYKENLAELERLGKVGKDAGDQDAILREFDEGIDEYLNLVYEDKKLSQTIDDIIDQSGTVDKEAAREYIVLEEILRDDSQELREIRQVARDNIKDDVDAQKASDLFERTLTDKITDRRNIARQKLADEESTLVDRKSWIEEIRKLDKDITGKLSEPGYVSIPNSKGEMEVWEVDPIAADLYKYSTRQPDMSKAARFFNETSKIFRLGTTGLNLMSFVNQSFRDFGNLWLTSGSYHLVNLSRATMVNQMGQEIANWYMREEPEVYKQLLEMAERKGKSIESMVVERELAIGRETSTQATETAFLKTVGDARTLNRISKGEMSITNSRIDRVVDTLSRPNEWRERYFRNTVYADSLNQALKRGYTLKSARTQAEFMMNNATTNFSRQLVHLQALQRTVPYLGAAINGTKSFWRIFSADPVGVMSRFVGGFVIPIMAFTGMALNDPVARKKYEQLSEYEKDNNIIINVNGSLMKIPIPQEIGPLVKPWQHLVEKMYDANRHDFWELMLNDALGISPMDITGFYDLDQDAMENPTIWDRLDNGATQLFWGQMAPPPVKAGYMLFTGKDPYTGKFIDTSYQYYDSESGEVLTMDSSTSSFAQALANQFGGPASVLAAVVNSLVGRTGMDVLDSLTSAIQYGASGGEEGSLTTIFERAGQAISKPITVADYDRTKTAWNREISALYREKEAIRSSEKYQKIEQAINQETDPQKRKSLMAQRQDMLEGWYEKTKVAINKLQDNFGGTIDRYRMASLISLLNMHENTGGLSAVGRAANDELYYEGRDEAIRTLINMGADETGDGSILGYMTTVKENDGSEHTEVKFYKPLEILAMQNAWYNNASVNASYIAEVLEDGPIDYKEQKKAIKKQIDAIYSKGKLTQNDYNAINAIELEWNARVMQAIAPYIERVSPESAINDEEVIEYLEDFIYVPSEFKKDKRGYYVTNKSLGQGSANDAYIKNYIRKIFEVNDTGYSSGKNYSGRETLGGQ